MSIVTVSAAPSPQFGRPYLHVLPIDKLPPASLTSSAPTTILSTTAAATNTDVTTSIPVPTSVVAAGETSDDTDASVSNLSLHAILGSFCTLGSRQQLTLFDLFLCHAGRRF